MLHNGNYSVLFSVYEQTHCASVIIMCLWMSDLPQQACFWISAKVVTALFGCYVTAVAGAMWNWCCVSMRSVFTIQPCTSLQRYLIGKHSWIFSSGVRRGARLCYVLLCHMTLCHTYASSSPPSFPPVSSRCFIIIIIYRPILLLSLQFRPDVSS